MDLTLVKNFKDSSVLVPLVWVDDEVHVLFTIRSAHVEHHKNQICFPGGAREEQDTHLWSTALREAEEELGLNPNHISHLGQLPTEYTPSEYKIYPFLAWVQSLENLRYETSEVAGHFTVPLTHFLNPEILRIEEKEFLNRKIQIPHYQFQDHTIWGATGRIISNVLKIYS